MEEGMQPLEIPFLINDNLVFYEYVQRVKEQLRISLEGDVCIEDFLIYVDYLIYKEELAQIDVRYRAILYSLKLYMALYKKDYQVISSVFDEIKTEHKSRPYLYKFGFSDFNSWYQYLENEMNSRDSIMERINMNKGDIKFKKMVKSKIIC